MKRYRPHWIFLFIPIILGPLSLDFVIWAIRGGGPDPLTKGERAYSHEDWRSAEIQARAALKARSDDRRALRLLARSSARQGNHESAEALYRRIGTKHMGAEDYFLLGNGLMGRGQTGPALAALGAARDEQPDHAETLNALSLYWLKTHTMSDAVDAAGRLAKRPGWEARGNVRLGILRSELFDPAGAATALTAALASDPKLAGADLEPRAARRLLARCWLEAGQPARARAQIEEKSSGHQREPEDWWLSSRALLAEGKIAEANRALEMAAGFGASDPLTREPAPFLGAGRCAKCHAAEFKSQQQSRHARTLVRTAELPGFPWPSGVVPDTNNPAVDHRVHRAGTHVDVETRVDNQVFRAVIAFAMGSNHQGQSFLAREPGGQVRELRLSRYPDSPEWSRTMEHPTAPPDAPGYLGRPVSPESFRRCLHCHSTNFRAIVEPAGNPVAADHGIGCERCHGPAGNHAAAVAASFPELAIARPRLASGVRIVALCGECHSAPPTTTSSDAGFVRYQASGLVLSRCYLESNQRLGCTTCHDPHKDVQTRAGYYESICLECHATQPAGHAPTTPRQPTAAVCRKNPTSGCLECHMPPIKTAIPRAVFTDHNIRIRHE